MRICNRIWMGLVVAGFLAWGGGSASNAQAKPGTLIAKAKAKKAAKKKAAKPAKKAVNKKAMPAEEAPAAAAKKSPEQAEEDKLPTGPAKIKLPMVEEKKAAGASLEEKLLEEEIAQLRDIIQTTSDGPAKADLLFRLAERYYEKARSIYYTEMQDYDKKVEEWVKAQEKNPNHPEPKIDNRKSQVYTKQAMDVYRIILAKYKDYPRKDEVLFTMGYNLYESGEKAEGVKMYWDLIKSYPDSKYVPDAYLAMGEHYFNANDVFNAKKAYERAISFKDSKVFVFALYKLAWCDYNLGDYEAGIAKFKEVVGLAQQETQLGTEGDKNKIQLQREALQDMVMAYSQLDALDAAEEYYVSQVGKAGALEYLRKLARTYEAQGKSELVIKAFRRLLDEYPIDQECPSFHNSIVLAYRKLNNREKVKQEVGRLIEQYKPGSSWAESNKSNQMAIKRANSLVEESLRDLVTSYHKEAQETKSWDTYNLARNIYGKYLENFPTSEYAYKLRWYYSDILYKMGDFHGAALQYAKVVEMDPKGAFSDEASYNAVLGWDKCIELRDTAKIDCREWKAKTGAQQIGKEEARTIKKEDLTFLTKGKVNKDELEKRDIPELEKKFLEAANLFASVAPKHDMYITIRFKSAFIFYKYRQYTEMAKRFGEIIERYPMNEFAVRAVRLSLNTMYMKATSEDVPEEERTTNWTEINHWAKAFLKNKVLMNSPAAQKEKFENEIQTLVEESGYNVILAQRKVDALAAAQGFQQFVKDYPKSVYSHRALYAALVIFDEAVRLDLAIEMGEKLLKQYPTSDRYNQTLFYMADFENRVANFDQAAAYNESFFEKWFDQTGKARKGKDGKKGGKAAAKKPEPKPAAKAGAAPAAGDTAQAILITDKEAADALYNAALLRDSMGQFEKAVKNYVRYIKHFPDNKDVQDLFYKIGQNYEKRGDWRKADRVYEGYPQKYKERSTAGRMLLVTYKHALMLRKLNKEKDADKLLDKIIEAYNTLPEDARNPEAREAVSYARFLQLENEFNEYMNIKLVLPPKTLERNLFKKIEIRPKLEKKYEEVVGFQDPDWSIAALVKIGQLSQNLSQSMYDAPVPGGLTPDQADIYTQELQNQALPLEEKAQIFYRKAIDVSSQKGIYNEWTLKAQELLRTYTPSMYPEPFDAELVSTEFFYQQGGKLEPLSVPEAAPEPTPSPAETPADTAGQPSS